MVLPRFECLAPKTLEEVSQLLVALGSGAILMAGGTDIIPPMKDRAIKPDYIIDIKGIPGLDKIEYDEKEGLKIGSLVKLFDIQTSELIHKVNPSIAQGAKYIASTQVRHKATMTGNICAAVPSCDTGPILVAQNAKLLIHGAEKNRELLVKDLFTSVKKTCLEHDEIVTAIVIPPLAENEYAATINFTVRKAMDLAIVGTGAWLQMDGEVVKDARIALGAVAATPIRAYSAEKALIGRKLTDEVLDEVSIAAMNDSHPISDVRASAEYRKDMVRVFVKRVIKKALQGYEGDHI